MTDVSYFFMLKKIIAYWADPVSLFLAFLAFCFLLRNVNVYFKKRLLKPMVVVVGILFSAISTPLVSYWLSYSLENPYLYESSDLNKYKGVDYIVVLACGHVESDNIPTVDRYNTCALKRIVHAVELHKKTKIPLLFSGGVLRPERESEALFNSRLAKQLGVNDYVVLPVGRDTGTESQGIYNYLNENETKGKVALVTNASHMKRSIRYMKRGGVDIVPAATDFTIRNGKPKLSDWVSYVPSSKAAKDAAGAMYEYLGLASQTLFE